MQHLNMVEVMAYRIEGFVSGKKPQLPRYAVLLLALLRAL